MQTKTLKKRIGAIVYDLLTVPRTNNGKVMIRQNELKTKHCTFRKGMPVMRKVHSVVEFEKVFEPKLQEMHNDMVLGHATKAAKSIYFKALNLNPGVQSQQQSAKADKSSSKDN